MDTENKPGASFTPDGSQPAPSQPPSTQPADTIPPPQTPSPVTSPTNKKSSKLKTILVALVAVILLGGAGTYAYLGVYVPNQPDAIVAEAFSNLLKADSLTFDGTLAIDAGADFSTEVDISGAVDGQNRLMDLTVGLDLGLTTVGLDFRGIEDTVYFRVSGLDGLDTLIASQLGLSEFGPEFNTIISGLLGDLNNTWYEASDTLLESSGLDADTDQAVKNLEEFNKAFNNHKFIKVLDVLDDEDINGKSAHHARVFINKDELKAAIDELGEISLAGIEITQESREDFYKELDKLSDEDLTFEAWVYKDGRNVAQLKLNLSDGEESASLVVRFDNFNQPVNVSAPDDAKNMIELYNSVLPLLMGGLEQSGLESGLDGLEGYDLEDLPSLDSELIPTVLGTFKDL